MGYISYPDAVMRTVGETFDFFGLKLTVDDIKVGYNYGFVYGIEPEFLIRASGGKSRHAEFDSNPFGIDHVIFNGPATIVFWTDGTKTVVKCAKGENDDKKTSILWAYAKKICGTSSHMNKVLDKLVAE